MHVLICDADAALRQVLKRVMTKAYGCDVSEAATGLEVFDALARRPADVIVVDVHLPIMNGVEVCEALRRSKQFQNTPLMVLTAERDEGVINSLIAAGVSDLVLKPLHTERFIQRFGTLVTKVLKSRNAGNGEQAVAPSVSLGSTVLVVDGDPEYQSLFERTLSGPFVVNTATTSAEAIARCLAHQPPNAVVIGKDLGLIGPDYLAKKLRGACAGRVRIIGAVSKREVEATRQAGLFDDVIPRSFVAATLKADFNRLLQQSSTLSQFQSQFPGLRSSMLAAAEQVCGLMLSVEIEAADGPLTIEGQWSASASVDLSVAGFVLHFTLRYGLEAGQYVAGAFLESPPDTMGPEEAESVAGELANVIIGRLHNMYGKTGANSSMSLPVISSGDAVAVVTPPTSEENSLCLALAAVTGPIAFEVRVWVEGPPEPEAAVSQVAGGLTVLSTE